MDPHLLKLGGQQQQQPSTEWAEDQTADSTIDDFNDETFGVDVNDLSTEWEQTHNQFAPPSTGVGLGLGLGGKSLPEFFKGQQNDDSFLEESLEDDPTLKGELLPLSHESHFPTQNEDYSNEEFFFLDTETEANANLDSQMESMFNLVLDEEEEQGIASSSTYSSRPIQNKQNTTEGSFSPTTSGIWGSKPQSIGMSPADNTWFPHSPAQPTMHDLQQKEENPLSKFFGGSIPGSNQSNPAIPPQQQRMMSLEELEARFTTSKQPSATPPIAQAPVPTHQQTPPRNLQNPEANAWQNMGKPGNMAIPNQGFASPPMHPGLGFPPRPQPTQMPFPGSPQMPNIQTRPLQQVPMVPKPADRPQHLQFRPRWKESKSLMTADEIDSIIRMQEAQLHNNNNPFAEDYYYLVFTKKRDNEMNLLNHKPLFESGPRNTPLKKPFDPLEGVLGRIPTHSVRAPRPLIQLKQSENPAEQTETDTSTATTQASSKVIHSLLLAIENAFNSLLDVEDIDSILKKPESVNYFNVGYLRQKREEITNELFKLLHIYVPPYGVIAQRSANIEEDQPTFIEDEIFINMTLVQKGKKLICRSLPVLFQFQLFSVIQAYMRNLSLILTSPRLETDLESTNKLFGQIHDIVCVLPVSNTIHILQTILSSHTDNQLTKVLQTKIGLNIMQTLLKRGHDLNLSPFGREEIALPEVGMQVPPLVSAGLRWKEVVVSFVRRMQGRMLLLFHSEIGSTPKIWEFFAVLVVNINQEDKKKLLNELR